MAIACTNSPLINSKSDEYNLYYAKCEHLNLQSGLVQNLKNKFMAMIESETQSNEEKNIRKYKSLENIENNYISNITHHKSLENICDTINCYPETNISRIQINLDNQKTSVDVNDKYFDFATIQSKFGKPTEGVRKRHTTKVNPYTYSQGPIYVEENANRFQGNFDKESKVQQIKNMFSKKHKNVINITYNNANINDHSKYANEHIESHKLLSGKYRYDSPIKSNDSLVRKSNINKSFVKSSSGIYFYYNNQDSHIVDNKECLYPKNNVICDLPKKVIQENNFVDESKNYLNCNESQKAKLIGVASAEIQKTKIHGKSPIGIYNDISDNNIKNSIYINSLPKKNLPDPEGYWRVTRDLVHKIRAKGRSYRFENGKRQELPTTIFLPMLKTNGVKENKSGNNLLNNFKENNMKDDYLYSIYDTDHKLTPINRPFVNSNLINATFSIVTPIFKEHETINNEQNLENSEIPQLTLKSFRTGITHTEHDFIDNKRFKIQYEESDTIDSPKHLYENNKNIDCEIDGIDDELTEEYYKNLSNQIQVFGAYIKLEKNCFLRASRKKCLRIKFDTAEPSTFEYPSEQSLLEFELENEDVKTRINAFNIKAATAEAKRLNKEPKNSLKQNLAMHKRNNAYLHELTNHVNTQIFKNEIKPVASQILSCPTKVEDIDKLAHTIKNFDKSTHLSSQPMTASVPPFSQLSMLNSELQPDPQITGDMNLANFKPKNLKNNKMILSFNDTFLFCDNLKSEENTPNFNTDENSIVLHTYPLPADDLVTSKWSITTTQYSDLLF